MLLQNELLNILQEFSLPREKFKISSLTAGLINDTYLVTQDTGKQYILQKINHQVFKNVAVLMNNISLALPLLNADAYTQLSFLPTTTNKSYLEKDGEYWRIMTYISESNTYNTTTDTTIAFEAGRIIGKFHSLLKPVNVALFKDTLPKFHNLAFRSQEFKDALENSSVEKLEIANNAILQAKLFLKELSTLANEKLPLRICHNDTKLNNILFSKTTHKALCLIDLDTLMKGYFFYDFGDAVRTVVNTAPEDETKLDKITFDENLFKAFVDGLASNADFLTKTEKESLPLGAVFMPFLHGLRALTDYLNNNTYYKVNYENQNLDRCLSLFYFAEKALKHKEMMAAYIQERL